MESSIQKKLPTVLVAVNNIQDGYELCRGIFLRSIEEKNSVHFAKFEQLRNESKQEVDFLTSEYHIDTKYYSCDIRITCISYSFLLGNLLKGTEDPDLHSIGSSSIEAIIFASNLIDNARDGVQEYTKFHNDLIERLNPNIMMCFANKRKDDNLDLYKVFNFGEEDYLIEIIDDELSSLKAAKEDTKPSPNAEKTGVDRVIENLQCHMWPNMEKKKVETKPLPKVDLLSQQEFGSPLKDQEGDKEKENNQEKASPKETKTDEQPKATEKKPSEPVSADKKVEDIYKEMLQQHMDEDEKELEELSNIFHSIQRFKETSKNLSDKERREQAANLIMKLMQNCKDFDDEEDDDDDDEDEEGAGSSEPGSAQTDNKASN